MEFGYVIFSSTPQNWGLLKNKYGKHGIFTGLDWIICTDQQHITTLNFFHIETHQLICICKGKWNWKRQTSASLQQINIYICYVEILVYFFCWVIAAMAIRHLCPPLLSNLEVSLFLTWTNLLAVGKIPLPDLLLLLLSYSGLGSRNVREFACV